MHEAIGRNQTLTDALDPARAVALHVALGLAGPPPAAGEPAPPFFHHIWFWEPVGPDGLGRDGHPKTGGFIPDLGLPRRMWAGGRLTFEAPLRLGLLAEKRSEILKVERKVGRSGLLGFVTIRHEIRQGDTLCVTEEQDLVYREDVASQPAPEPPRAPEDQDPKTVGFSTTLLFRYSALTMNGHRIHYDAPYAREVEGYGGLVVHGPLLAQLLMLRAAEQGSLRAFQFRARSALIDSEKATLCQDGSAAWVRGPDGRLCMTAEADWADR